MKGPLLINFEGKQALVVGAGPVGRRRGETLGGYGCRVTMLDLNADTPEKITAPGIVFYPEPYHEKWLGDMDFVVAATADTALNRRIVKDCRERGIFCNAVDAPEASDFIFPSVITRGDLSLSVCTDGASPSLTKAIKAELEARYDESYTERTALLRRLRESVLAAGLSESDKRQYLKAISHYTIDALRKEVEKI